MCLLASCTLTHNVPVTVIVTTREPTAAPATATPEITPTPSLWTDENATFSGICYEAADAQRDEVYILRSAEEHIRFYEAADALCRRPVTRYPFDFEGGRLLAGLWSSGVGCTARHDVQDARLADGTLSIRLRFVVEGDCSYSLLRPFWVGVGAAERVEITLETAPAAN